MNIKNIVFFNHWRNGDCFINRNYVKEIINHFSNVNFYYAHNNHNSIIEDINCTQIKISSIPPQIHFRIRMAYNPDGTLYINTWIGAYEGELFHTPQHANFIILYKAWKFVFDNIGIKINNDFAHYHPTVDYSVFDLTEADNYINDIKNKSYKKLVLISNGKQQSEQSDMGNMENVIRNIATEFADHEFLVCDNVNVNLPNVTYVNDMFNGSVGNLNQISYLSTFADIIIGKNSGPFSYSHVRENMNNYKKTFLCFSKDIASTLMGDGKYYANALFSNTIDDTIATNITRNVIINTPVLNELKETIHV